MKLDEAVARFKRELEMEYGVGEGLVKIALSPELFNTAILDLFRRGSVTDTTNLTVYRPINWAEPEVLGVKIVARRRDDF